jgi:hypothetical protein
LREELKGASLARGCFSVSFWCPRTDPFEPHPKGGIRPG